MIDLDDLVDAALRQPPLQAPSVAQLRKRADQRRQRRRTARLALTLVPVLILAAAAFGLTAQQERRLFVASDGADTMPLMPERVVVVPDLVGSKSEDALQELGELGLAPLVIDVAEAVGSPDTVLSVNPPAGSEVPASAVVTITISFPADEGGPLDYATTERQLPVWPHALVSDPPSTTSAYGLRACDGGSATRRTALISDAGPEHAYYGTLCPFIVLADSREFSTSTCSTVTSGVHYARCQRRTDQARSEGPGTANLTSAADQQQELASVLPKATSSDEPQIFGTNISAAKGPSDEFDHRDDAVTIAVVEGSAEWMTCYRMEFASATATGCLDQRLLASGLAYGAFQNGLGTIEFVGIVPDDVATVSVADTQVPVANNIWRYTSPASGESVAIQVRTSTGQVVQL